MANPFDPRTVLLARHAQHVVLIHFPIALFLTGVFLDLAARGQRESRMGSAADVNFAGAAITILPAFLTGILAWRFVLDGERIHGLLLLHVISASTTAVLVIACWWIRRHKKLRTSGQFVLEIAGAILIAVTAHLGGFLSGVNS
jgi:uncharacterized membrane protein